MQIPAVDPHYFYSFLFPYSECFRLQWPSAAEYFTPEINLQKISHPAEFLFVSWQKWTDCVWKVSRKSASLFVLVCRPAGACVLQKRLYRGKIFCWESLWYISLCVRLLCWLNRVVRLIQTLALSQWGHVLPKKADFAKSFFLRLISPMYFSWMKWPANVISSLAIHIMKLKKFRF